MILVTIQLLKAIQVQDAPIIVINRIQALKVTLDQSLCQSNQV